jgi:hypothetical protein
MSLDASLINKLQSVRIRNNGFKRKAVLPLDQELNYWDYLKLTLGENVFVVKTALGIDVIYLSEVERTAYIHQALYLFKPLLDIDTSITVKRLSNEAVLKDFGSIVKRLSNHPQLFLSSCKKLILKFNQTQLRTPLSQLLYNCFDAELNTLIASGKIPYAAKIKTLRTQQEDVLLEPQSLSNLTKRYLSNSNHDN